MPTASNKTASKTAAITPATVPSKVQAMVTQTAQAAQLKVKADLVATQKIVILGETVGKLMKGDTSERRKATSEGLKPFVVNAYTKAGFDTKYAGEQLARILTLAFGGEKLIGEPKKLAAAKKEYASAKAINANVNDLLSCIRGSAKVKKVDGKLAVVSTTTRSASNAKAPKDAFAEGFATLAAAAKTGKLDLKIIGVAIADGLKTAKLINGDEADQIQGIFDEIG